MYGTGVFEIGMQDADAGWGCGNCGECVDRLFLRVEGFWRYACRWVRVEWLDVLTGRYKGKAEV